MVQMTMNVPDEFAKRIEPITTWLPTIIEISLIGFKTLATVTATEVVEFFLDNPTPLEVLDYHVSEASQARLQRLLALNASGLLSETEQKELDELQRLEHTIVMLKARIASSIQ